MSIVTTSSSITINKPNGQTQFTSEDKFIYYKRSASGSLTINNSTDNYAHEHHVNYNAPGGHEFTLKFATITACTDIDGVATSATANLIGLKLPMDNGLLLHVRGWNKDNTVAAYSIALVSGEVGNTVIFRQESSWAAETANYLNLSFNYHFITYAYL